MFVRMQCMHTCNVCMHAMCVCMQCDSLKAMDSKISMDKNPYDLPNNFTYVFGQLQSLEKRLKKSPAEYSKLYDGEQMNDMVKRNVARKLTDTEILEYSGPVHYIPHHGVTKTSASSTPLRVVFKIQQIEKVSDSGGFKVNHWIISGSKNNTSKSNSLNIIDTNEGSVLGIL